MLREFRIVIEPPKCIRGKDKMSCAVPSQLFKVINGRLAVAWVATVNGVAFEEMPAFAVRVVEDRWIAGVGGNDQRIGSRNSV